MRAAVRLAFVCAPIALSAVLVPASPGGRSAVATAFAAVGSHPTPAPHPPARSGTAPREYSCPLFPASNPFNQDISHAPVDAASARYIAAIGAGVHLHADFGANPGYGIPYTVVGPRQPKVGVAFTEYGAESDRGPYPIPSNARVEGAGEGGDRHLLVVQEGSCRLYELYSARRNGAGWEAASGAVFNLRSNALRPDGWTSADGAGLPIFPLLVRYPEVRAGRIDHALRVTVRRTERGYIHPATHFASAFADPSLPPMGLRLRLKASFGLAGYHGEALVVLRAPSATG
jgi:hypothetical protein